jgi:putative DNA primase/helicase
VPFKEKEAAKALGAKWDRQEKSWYVPGGVNLAPFAQWEKPAVTAETDALKAATANENLVEHQKPAQERHYLAVPYGERAAAKASGAIWDKAAKTWYAGPDGDMAKLERWEPGNVPNQQGPAMHPEDEFAEALRALGCVVDGQHPIMDGAKHRIVVEGDKANSSERSGFYVGHLDGHPAGYIKNNRTGVEMKWKSKGYALDPEEKAQLQAEAAIKLRDREMALQAKQKAVAVDILALLSVSAPAPADHPYLQAKQVSPGDLRIVPPATTVLPEESSIIIGKDWKESAALREANPDKLVFTAGDLLVPAHDANGTVWTVQTIQSSGKKLFAKDSRKEDCFHVIGGFDALAKAPAIVIGEGFATAGSLSETLGFPTVSAFDSGNLVLVAKALQEKFPDKPIVIAGDDDKHLESTQGYNPGRSKANEAAKAVGGKVLLPIFAPGEQAYPENLEPVTPVKARAGELSDEQKEAIAKMKSFTDFNDLATKSLLGKEGIERQVRSVVFSVIDKHPARIEQPQELVQQQAQRPRRAAKI